MRYRLSDLRFLIKEELASSDIFYHGSSKPLSGKLIAKPRLTEFSDRHDSKGVNIEKFIEGFKPSSAPSRLKCIFMSDNVKDLNLLGASENYVYEVKPLGSVIRADFAWVQEVLGIVFEGELLSDNPFAEELAKGYWSNKSCPYSDHSRPLWEYLTMGIEINVQVNSVNNTKSSKRRR